MSSATATAVTVSTASESTPLVEKKEDAVPWPRILRFCAKYMVPRELKFRLYVAYAVAMSILADTLSLVRPIIAKFIIDEITRNAGRPPSIDLVPWKLIAATFLISELGGFVRVVSTNAQTRVKAEMKTHLGVDFFHHLHALSLSYHLEYRTGEVLKIMDRGPSAAATIFRILAFTIAPLVANAVIICGVFFHFRLPLVALICAITVCGYVYYVYRVTGIRTRLRRQEIRATNDVRDCEVQTLTMAEVVMAFGRGEAEVSRYDRLSRKVQDICTKETIVHSWLEVCQRGIQRVGRYAALFLACSMTLIEGPGRVSPGDLLLIPELYTRLFSPFRMLSYQYELVTTALTNLEQIVSVWEKKPDIVDSADAISLESDNPSMRCRDVVFDHVSFRYDTSEDSVGKKGRVTDVSFRAAPGRKVALVGETGSGKTTLIRLLLRLYDVQDGSILLSGIDIRKLSQKSLRGAIGVVSQQTVLFNDTLLYNIRYAKPEATVEDVLKAAQAADLGDFIAEQKKGILTVVGERGVKLSGGQLQRVGIARALLKEPSILVLDEATAALDSFTGTFNFHPLDWLFRYDSVLHPLFLRYSDSPQKKAR